VPYRGTRYHLKEWGRANERPSTPEELFNLRHAQLRNVVERIFGILKRCFRILLCISPEFLKETQTQIVPALAAIHNFRRINGDGEEDEWDPDEDRFDNADPFTFPAPEPFEECGDPFELTAADLSAGITAAETGQANARRDAIAARMWASYQAYLAAHV